MEGEEGKEERREEESREAESSDITDAARGLLPACCSASRAHTRRLLPLLHSHSHSSPALGIRRNDRASLPLASAFLSRRHFAGR